VDAEGRKNKGNPYQAFCKECGIELALVGVKDDYKEGM
jgi:hypothetical protein